MNPVLETVAARAAATDHPISGITVYAPLVTGPAAVAINWLAFDRGDDDGAGPMPRGIGAMISSRVPSDIVMLPPLTDAGALAINAAWAQGAWDVQRTVIGPGYTGQLPPVGGQLPGAHQQGLVSWYWRPMLRGPEIRAKSWAAKDVTLNPWSLGRDAAPPPVRVPPLRPDSMVVIKLGSQARPIVADVPERPWLALEGGRVVIALPWHREVVALLRTLPGRRYHPEDRTWSVPARGIPALIRAMPKIDAIMGEP